MQHLISIWAGLLAAASLHAQSPYASLQVPQQIQYQGRVATAAGGAWSGTEGYFVFALVQGATVLWNNWDGITSPSDPDTVALGAGQVLTLPVIGGVFSIRLGEGSDTNEQIPATVFFDAASNSVRSGVKLAVWFSPDGGTFTRLSPDVEFTAVPFAMVSGIAETVQDRSITTQKIKDGAVTSMQLADNTIQAVDLASASVTPEKIAAGAVGSSQLAPDVTLAGTTTGTFSGNGAGLSGITAASVAIPPGMALIPAGTFTMGDSLDGIAAPVSVTVSAFYMDVNEVTLSLWQSVYYWATSHGYTFTRVGAGKGVNHPVHTVNWYDCVKWCNARSEQAGIAPVYYKDAELTLIYKSGEVPVFVNWAAKGYRLPTEAEWEKAARGGLSEQRFPWGNTITQNLANYYAETASYSYDLGPNGLNATGSIGGTSPATSPVGSFAANGYGLNDMAGNVGEWCWDWYGTPYAGGSDPHGATSGSSRVIRGGRWDYYANYCRVAYRYDNAPGGSGNNRGFRVVRSSVP
ncbi:MAG: SUMF1/EgtB/PvdO family nonheme iron enzyme [Verrucomicrobia bacterium]|nr:SUMF1/EgtB/PvdO family nonheme iron enzyme [Verrucomicrobiota bacterium]